MPDPVRVRFAPSPTGLLHIGGLRTALYNVLFARQHGGTFVLRVEDTDRARYVPEAEADIVESMRWAGLDYDEGPGKDGGFGPYHQSERKGMYLEHVQRLLDSGGAYYAFDTPEELDAMRERLQSPENPSPRYDAATRMQMTNALTLDADEVQRRIDAGEEVVVRLKVPPGETVRFDDMIRGGVAFDTSEIDDQVLLKSDGHPTYHLANVVDDHAMEITHVIRGEEWLPSVPKHLLLYRAFGWTPPQMAHLPLILSPTGGKLSKRNADKMGIPVSVKDYRAAGYEPDALVNFLAFLGWNPGDERELFSFDELVDAYSVERTSHSGAQFDLDKLNWYNGQYLRQKSVADLAEEAKPYLHEAGIAYDEDTLHTAVALMQDRLAFAKDLATEAAYFFEDPTEQDYHDADKKRWKDDSADLLTAYADRLEALDTFTAETAEAELRALAEEREAGAGRIIHPARLAVSGVGHGPSLFDLMAALGQAVCVRRMRRAVAVLG